MFVFYPHLMRTYYRTNTLKLKDIFTINTDAILFYPTGRFLLTKMDDPDNAEEMLKRAVQLDDKSEVGLFNLGKLYHRCVITLPICVFFIIASKNIVKSIEIQLMLSMKATDFLIILYYFIFFIYECRNKADLVNAESVLQQLLVINPTHVNGWRLLAKVFIEASKVNRIEYSVPNTPAKGSFGGTIGKFPPLSTLTRSQSVNFGAKTLSGFTPSKSQQFNVSHKTGKQSLDRAMDCYEKAIEIANDVSKTTYIMLFM